MGAEVEGGFAVCHFARVSGGRGNIDSDKKKNG